MLTPFGLAIYQARGVIIECLLGMCKSRKLPKQRKNQKNSKKAKSRKRGMNNEKHSRFNKFITGGKN